MPRVKKPESADMTPDNTPEVTSTQPLETGGETESKTLEVLQKMQEQMSAQNEVIANLQADLAKAKQEANKPAEPELVDTERKPASTTTLATVDGMPITNMQLTKKTKINDAGQTVIIGLEAVCEVYGKDKPITITYGDADNPTDYLNLPRVKFEMVDAVDVSGASKVESDKVVQNDGVVPEKKLVNNVLVPTGRMVQLAVKQDVRYYTILVGDEKVTLREDKIYR